MTTYLFPWNGTVHRITPPLVVPSSAHTRYLIAFLASNGNELEAMKTIFRDQYPGIDWEVGAAVRPPRSFAFSDKPCGEPDRSYRASPQHNHSQRHRPPHAASRERGGVSGSAAPNRHPPQSATSSASSPRDPRAKEGYPQRQQPSSKPVATPHTAGWMGSAATK